MMTVPSKVATRSKSALTTVILFLLLWGSAVRTHTDLGHLVSGIGNMGDLFAEMVPPHSKYAQKIVNPLVQTLQMAILGTSLGGIVALPFVLLAARNVTRAPWLSWPARIVLNLIRTIPDLLLASIFVAIFGIGAFSGVLSLAVLSFGIISKLWYESAEAIDDGPLEAMTAVGANKLQWIAFGVVPQVLPIFTAHLLYTFEINVRAATILGLVGAGGIGLYLNNTLGLFQYQNTSVIVIAMLMIVFVIDFTSTKLRERLL
ncbi:phosphonate ABC transporter, permease protein PhnE [Alicyclobacillus pomorum]|uniref:phosphonate ABC transporter, permease protein PhnE n=1 Tax=Alicyclobacillus pomorum TaxID=204470 RepID=UPI0003F5006F